MPVKRNAGESESDFISRCISEEMGKGHEQQQSIAICYSYLNMSKESRDAVINASKWQFRKLFENKTNTK